MVPDMKAHSNNRDVFLSVDSDIAQVLKEEMNKNPNEEAAALSQAAKIVRRDILERDALPFRGMFDLSDHENAIPRSLLFFIRTVLHGSKIDEPKLQENKASYTIAEMLIYNT